MVMQGILGGRNFCLGGRHPLLAPLVTVLATLLTNIVLRYGNAFRALVISPVYDIIILALHNHKPVGGQNFETSISKKHD